MSDAAERLPKRLTVRVGESDLARAERLRERLTIPRSVLARLVWRAGLEAIERNGFEGGRREAG